VPDAGDWLDVCCAHARWHLQHPERSRLPRTDTIAAAIVARAYLRTLARFPGRGRTPSAVVRTSLRQVIVGLGRIWGWDLTDYPERPTRRERDVVDRHAKGLRRRMRPLVEGGLLQHRVVQDLELEDAATEFVLLPLPAWSPEERAIGRALHDSLAAALRRPESRAAVLMAQLDGHQAGGAQRGRDRAQAAQKARAAAASRPDLDDLADFPSFAPPKSLSAHPASRTSSSFAPSLTLGSSESSRGEDRFAETQTRGDAWLQPYDVDALSGTQPTSGSRNRIIKRGGSVPCVPSPALSTLERSAGLVDGWSGDPDAVPGARVLAEAWHHAKFGQRAEDEPMMLVGRTARDRLVATARRGVQEQARGGHLQPLGPYLLAQVDRYPHPHAGMKAVEGEIRRTRALREVQGPVTDTMILRAWRRLDRDAPDWLMRNPDTGAPLVGADLDSSGAYRLAVTRELQPAELYDRRVQGALEAAALVRNGRAQAVIELEHPGGLAARIHTRRGRHSLMADGASIYVPGHTPTRTW
jgi:hypothetical protein